MAIDLLFCCWAGRDGRGGRAWPSSTSNSQSCSVDQCDAFFFLLDEWAYSLVLDLELIRYRRPAGNRMPCRVVDRLEFSSVVGARGARRLFVRLLKGFRCCLLIITGLGNSVWGFRGYDLRAGRHKNSDRVGPLLGFGMQDVILEKDVLRLFWLSFTSTMSTICEQATS